MKLHEEKGSKTSSVEIRRSGPNAHQILLRPNNVLLKHIDNNKNLAPLKCILTSQALTPGYGLG